MISVMVVDDHEIIRKALKYVLESDPEIKVVCMASNGFEALCYCEKSIPDVILMDIMMPVLNGVEGTKKIKEKFPMVKIILITTFDEEKYIEEGLLNGADAYITKDIREEDLKSIIRSTYNGFSIVHSKVFRHMKGNRHISINKIGYDTDNDIKLTDREREVLQLLVDGKSNKEIALALYIVEGRVKNIISKLLNKFSLQYRTQLAVFAVKNSLVK